MRRGFGSGETAVSDVIGTVLLLGITVGAFSVLAVAVLDQFERSPPPARVEFRVDTANQRTSITSVWGEPLGLDDTQLIYSLDGVRTTRDFSNATIRGNLTQRAAGSNESWEVGESLRLACPALGSCAHPGRNVTNVSVIQFSSNSVVFSSEPGVSRGALINPVADLVVTIVSIVNPDPSLPNLGNHYYDGGDLRITAKVANVGVIATPNGGTFQVTFLVDATSFPPYTHSTFLGPGDSFITSVTVDKSLLDLGPHSLRVRVNASMSFLEAGYTNNEATSSIEIVSTVFDPGFPYLDHPDGEIWYSPYSPDPNITADSAIDVTEVLDGEYTAVGTWNLVIPPSVGTIETGLADIRFEAPLDVIIGANLTTTSEKRIFIDAGEDIDLSSSQFVSSDHDLELDASGIIDVSGVVLNSERNSIRLDTPGQVLAIGAYFYDPGLPASAWTENLYIGIDLDGPVNLTGATIAVRREIIIRSDGDADLQGATLSAGDNIEVDSEGSNREIRLQGATIRAGFLNGAPVVGNLLIDLDDDSEMFLEAALLQGNDAITLRVEDDPFLRIQGLKVQRLNGAARNADVSEQVAARFQDSDAVGCTASGTVEGELCYP